LIFFWGKSCKLATLLLAHWLDFSSCGNWLRINCLHILFWKMYRTVRDFYRTGKKPLAVRELVQDTYQARSETANPILFKF
jgi:hypothetical protein